MVNYGTEGREFESVRTHGFKDKDLVHAIPHGVYDIASDEGWISVGIDKDTSQCSTREASRSSATRSSST